jgi:hypothetical protein
MPVSPVFGSAWGMGHRLGWFRKSARTAPEKAAIETAEVFLRAKLS